MKKRKKDRQKAHEIKRKVKLLISNSFMFNSVDPLTVGISQISSLYGAVSEFAMERMSAYGIKIPLKLDRKFVPMAIHPFYV